MDQHEEEKKVVQTNVSEEEQKHFIVLRIGSGLNFKPILHTKDNLRKIAETGRTDIDKEKVQSSLKRLLRAKSDPYVGIQIDSNPSFQTRVVFNCEDAEPKWIRFERIYLDPQKFPKTITISAFDKSDDPLFEDALYGSYTIECNEANIFENKGEIWSNNVQLSTTCAVDFSICYDCCAAHELQQRMTTKQFSTTESQLSKDTISWITNNTQLYQDICESATSALKLTSDMFSDIDYPPNKYRIARHFKQFASSYACDDSDKKSIYYDTEHDALYVIPNNSEDNMHLGGLNVTREIHLLWRYVFLKNEVLAGQDAEFNIYKSFLFDPTPEKLVFCFITVTIQLALTVSICYEIIQGFPFGFDQEIEGTQLAIKVLSGGVFVLLSISANRTTKLYYQFYEQIGSMFSLPWFILIADFVSNILIVIVITLFSYLFLIQSETFTDLVLNSFALQFVTEIDDMINTFDSDEDIVLEADLRAFYKANCLVPRKITYTWMELAGVLWSPFCLLQSLKTAVLAIKSVFFAQHHKAMLVLQNKGAK